jgi:hypothetical protein
LSAIFGGSLLLGSCSKQAVTPEPQTQFADFSYSSRTASELIQAADEQLYAALLNRSQSSRKPVVRVLGGRFFWRNSSIGGCAPQNGVCAIEVVDDHTPIRSAEELATEGTDIWSMAQDVNTSPNKDMIIVNEATPVVRQVRGITDVSVSADGEVNFKLVE